MENYGYVYKTTNVLDNKVYIGQKLGNEFNSNYTGSGLHIKRAVKKYGKIHFKVELIAYASVKKALDNLEKFYIAEMRRLLSDQNVYNISDGGAGERRCGVKNPFYGKHHSPETKKRWSSIRRGRKLSDLAAKHIEEMNVARIGKSLSAEHKAKLSIVKSGINNAMYGKVGDKNPMYGRKHSKETKEKIRIRALGRHASVETRMKMSASRLGKKINVDRGGDKNPNYKHGRYCKGGSTI